jgi:hypothetical protein
MRPQTIDWELYKEQLLQLRAEGKSLTDVNKVLYEKLGKCVTNARLSQIFKQWREEKPTDAVTQAVEIMQKFDESPIGEEINAN